MNDSDAEIKRLSQEASAIFKRCSALSEEAARLYNESAQLSRKAKASFFGRDKLIADAKQLMSEADKLMNEQKRLMPEGQKLLQQAKELKSNANDNESSENNGIESEQLPAVRQEKQTDLYRFGIDTIIGGTVQFAAPFYLLSKRVLDQTTFNGSLQNYSVDSCKLDHYHPVKTC